MDVTIDGRDFLPEGRICINAQIDDWTEELGIVEQALAVARVYGVDDKVAVSIEDLLRHSNKTKEIAASRPI